MINLFKKVIQVLSDELAQSERFNVNAENEYLVMSCGAFSPQFLAKIKRSKTNNSINTSDN